VGSTAANLLVTIWLNRAFLFELGTLVLDFSPDKNAGLMR
jgi:hypothetical protein